MSFVVVMSNSFKTCFDSSSKRSILFLQFNFSPLYLNANCKLQLLLNGEKRSELLLKCQFYDIHDSYALTEVKSLMSCSLMVAEALKSRDGLSLNCKYKLKPSLVSQKELELDLSLNLARQLSLASTLKPTIKN